MIEISSLLMNIIRKMKGNQQIDSTCERQASKNRTV